MDMIDQMQTPAEAYSGNVPVRELERKSRKRRLVMPDQARGSKSASLLKPRRTICSFVSFPISSGSCPMSPFSAYIQAAAKGLASSQSCAYLRDALAQNLQFAQCPWLSAGFVESSLIAATTYTDLRTHDHACGCAVEYRRPNFLACYTRTHNERVTRPSAILSSGTKALKI